MLYAASVQRTGKSNCTWLLVNKQAFEPGKKNDPIIEVKTDIDRMITSIKRAFTEAKNTNKKLKIWTRGQGIREISIDNIHNIKVVPLDFTGNSTRLPTGRKYNDTLDFS